MLLPSELATGDRTAFPAQWPSLAAEWLIAGFDSPQLRWLASLTGHEAETVSTLQMRDVLRSIGVSIPSETELVERCAHAFSVVQRDLDATGFDDARFRPVECDNVKERLLPAYHAELIGRGWDHNVEPLDPTVGAAELLRRAASAVSETILEIWLLAWPTCIEHDGPQLDAIVTSNGVSHQTPRASWRCSRGRHLIAPVGELSSDAVHPRWQAE